MDSTQNEETFLERDILFHYETKFKLGDSERQKRKLQLFLEREKIEAGCIQYTFMSDDQLLSLNQEHLNHDSYTDIITFDLSIGQQLSADIFISMDRVKENAQTEEVPWEEELDRVMVHGLLHLIGYDDKTEEEKKQMRSKEDEYVSAFKKIK